MTAAPNLPEGFDPTDPDHIVASSGDYNANRGTSTGPDARGEGVQFYTSFDGGVTWTNVQVPGLTAETGGQGQFAHVDSAGDPAMSIAPDGTVYYANIVFNRDNPASGVAVSVSHDGGLTWGAPNMVTWVKAGNFFNDKEWIVGGPNGKAVVTWTVFYQGPHGAG